MSVILETNGNYLNNTKVNSMKFVNVRDIVGPRSTGLIEGQTYRIHLVIYYLVGRIIYQVFPKH